MGEMVTFAANGGTASGYLAKPASGSGKGVVMEAFKPGTGPADTYWVIGSDLAGGSPEEISPSASRAIQTGGGGLY